jgi:aminoglycoside phosphotransferase (APT) family kinase protein
MGKRRLSDGKVKEDLDMKEAQVLAKREHKTICREGDRVYKIFDDTFLKSDILKEGLNHAFIEDTGIRVPKLLEVTVIDGKWALVYEYIEGRNFADYMAAEPDKKAELLDRFVDIQLDLHSHECPGLTQMKDKMQKKISASKLDATTRYELHLSLDTMPTHRKVCHMDYNPSNIIITNEDVPYVLDWAQVSQGNAAADAAKTYMLFCMNDDYETADQYLRLYCKKSDTAKQYVQKWMPIVAASQLARSDTEERLFLRNWVNIID